MKILIVEDDPMVRLINRRFVERITGLKDAVINESESAINALALADLADYDLVLLDMYLPQMSGTEFLTTLVDRQLHPQVIMMTAANDQQTVRLAMDYGVLDFLIKPFTFERFEQAIDKFLRRQSVDQKAKVSQADIDSVFLGEGETPSRSQELPKGLSKLTLQRVLAIIQVLETDFSNQDVADQSGLSRVSTKKYLDFLAEIGFLTSKVVYRGSGRPLTKFYPNATRQRDVTSYL